MSAVLVAYKRQSNGTWAPVVPSPDGMIVTAPSTVPITDAAGNVWTIGTDGIVAVNGAPDLTTYGVTQLAYVNGQIWQSAGITWYSKSTPLWIGSSIGPFSAALAWTPPTTNADGTPIVGLSGYVVSYGLSATTLTRSLSVTASSATIVLLTPGTWYFAVAAVNKFGVKGANSNIVSKII